ncbi:nucleotidyltransferase family protein [Noviherbaspirillum aerium]|uniref:nucleotidyltransferase family protein n=1 Tax=Noviherbaspirillum aerium TaxID=2588497 RepID=UPI00124D406E|nr:nucleotidyltransferase family protein [Noviherbaspirillum aerium]
MRPSEAWRIHRAAIINLVKEHHCANPRVFGPTARGEDTEQSDLDLLIDPTEKTTLIEIHYLKRKLRTALGVRVDVCTPNSISGRIRDRVLSTAIPI